MRPLSIDLGELKSVWKWQTQMSSCSRDMAFESRQDSKLFKHAPIQIISKSLIFYFSTAKHVWRMKFGLWGFLAFPISRNCFDLEFRPESCQLGSLLFPQLNFPLSSAMVHCPGNFQKLYLGNSLTSGSAIFTQSSTRWDLSIEVSFDLIQLIWINPIENLCWNGDIYFKYRWLEWGGKKWEHWRRENRE